MSSRLSHLRIEGLEEWTVIVAKLQEMRQNMLESVAKEWDEYKYNRGAIDMIDYFVGLPRYLFEEKEDAS